MATLAIRTVAIVAASALAACDEFADLAPDGGFDGGGFDGGGGDGDGPVDAMDFDVAWSDGSGPPRCLMRPMPPELHEGSAIEIAITMEWMPPKTSIAMLTLSGPALASLAPASLVFTTANWATPQTVTLEALHDDDAFDELVSLSCTTGHTTESLSWWIVDDERVRILVDPPSAGGIAEGTSSMVRVSLSAQPAADVVMTATPNDPGAVAASPDSFTFTPADWATPQTLTLLALDDDDVFDEITAVTLFAPGIQARSVGIGVWDDD